MNAASRNHLSAATRSAASSPEEIRSLVEDFLQSCKEPALLEPGEDLFPLAPESYALEVRGSRVTLQAWDRDRNLTRRILSAKVSAAGRLELTVERFARRQVPA
jgi:hypothetical protein